MTDVPARGVGIPVKGRADPTLGTRRARVRDDPTLDLEDVYRSHADLVWRLVRRAGIPEANAPDVVHEVFLVVHRRLADYDGRASVSTWLYHLTRGVVSNHRRGRQREERRLLHLAAPALVTDPEQQARRAQAADLARRALAGLDADKRAVFELVELCGLSVPETAEACGIKLNTAYSRLRAARQRFQAEIDRLQGASAGRTQGGQQ